MIPAFQIYQDEKFLKVLEDTYQLEKINIFGDEEWDGITTFFMSKKKSGLVFNMPFNFYFSPTIDEQIRTAFFKKLREFSETANRNIIIKSLINYGDFNKNLYANNPIVHLRENRPYSKNLKKNINRNINKCKRLNIHVDRSNSVQDLKSFYDNVLSEVYIKKHKMVFQPFKLYKKLFENGLIDIFLAKKEEEVLAGLICMRDGNVLHYNWGANLNYENIALGTVLIDYAIEYAKKNKYDYFDLGSTPLSDENLFSFKMKWGAFNYPVYQYYTISRPSVIDLNNSLKSIRHIYSKFPRPFLRWLMPKIVPWLVQ